VSDLRERLLAPASSGGSLSVSAPAISEGDFQRQVTDLAEILGWQWAHFRPAETSKGWRTPVSGPLGKGFPDLVLVKGSRLIFAELKRDGAKLTPDQLDVLAAFADAADTHVWRPADFDEIQAALS
jgi:hypothetical protein